MISSARHPTARGPSCIFLGNSPAFSSRQRVLFERPLSFQLFDRAKQDRFPLQFSPLNCFGMNQNVYGETTIDGLANFGFCQKRVQNNLRGRKSVGLLLVGIILGFFGAREQAR